MQENGLPDYRPSRVERKRLEQFEITHAGDGTQQIVDMSTDPWEPTERQISFLENLLDDEDCKLDLFLAMKSVDGTKRELNQWCRAEPRFLMLFRERVRERFEIAELGADLTVVGAASGELEPSKHERWGVNAIIKIKEFLDKKEMRFIQINQFNIGVSADMDDERLLKVINEGSAIASSTIAQVIEGG